MSVPFEELVAAAREFIRSEGGRAVETREVLEELNRKFGDRFPTCAPALTVLELIKALWADPDIDRVPDAAWAGFAWNERGEVDQGLLRNFRDAARPPNRTGAERRQMNQTFDAGRSGRDGIWFHMEAER